MNAMAFTEHELAVNQTAMDWFFSKRRPPEHIRSQLDFGFTTDGHTVELFEIRPHWKEKTILRQHPIARIRYVRTQDQWNLYWMRGDLKWYLYEPAPLHSGLLEALMVVADDQLCCFFG